MANRRMFARTVTNSGRFLRLSAQSRALYYDLGMEADDDGFVEAYVRLSVTGSREENLMELEKAGFIRICDRENLVVYILDWQKNNLIRADRYNPSVYKDMYLPETQQKPEEITQAKPEETQQNAEQKSEPVSLPAESEPITEETVNQAETICHPDGCFLGDTRLTQVRLGKVSIGKGSLEEVREDQLRKEEFNSVQNRIGTPALRESDFDAEKSAPPQNEEADMDFEEKRKKYLKMLLDSEYFRNKRTFPESCLSV